MSLIEAVRNQERQAVATLRQAVADLDAVATDGLDGALADVKLALEAVRGRLKKADGAVAALFGTQLGEIRDARSELDRTINGRPGPPPAADRAGVAEGARQSPPAEPAKEWPEAPLPAAAANAEALRDAIGKWPGGETDEQIREALDELQVGKPATADESESVEGLLPPTPEEAVAAYDAAEAVALAPARTQEILDFVGKHEPEVTPQDYASAAEALAAEAAPAEAVAAAENGAKAKKRRRK